MDDSDQKKETKPQAALPILPSLLQIISMVAALYPHFGLDVDNDRVLIKFGQEALVQSQHALAMGCAFLLFGYYASQYLVALFPVRKEYAGLLGIQSMLGIAVLLLRTVLYPSSLLANPLPLAQALFGMALVTPLLQFEKAAEKQTSERAINVVLACTHALWVLYAGSYHYLLSEAFLGRPSYIENGWLVAAVVVADVVGLFRVVAFVYGRQQKSATPKVKEN